MGCLTIVGFFVFITAIAIIFGENNQNTNQTVNEENNKEVIIDVNKFSRVSSDKLVSLMGEPEKIEDYEWLIPTTGENIVGKVYIYDQNKYEFILFDDAVARLNVYSGKYMGYDESTMNFDNEEDIFAMFGIKPNSYFKKIADTNYALRYSPVSDTVADVWIQEINDKSFEIAKITYNLNYY